MGWMPLKPASSSFIWQGVEKFTHHGHDRLFLLPGLVVVFQPEWIGSCDDNHIELIYQDNKLSSMSPGKGDMMFAHLG